MPELPEVETVARQLAPLIDGRVAQRLQVLDRQRLTVQRPTRIRDRRVESVRRLGKQLVICFAGAPPLYIVVHLRMTGRLIWCDQQQPVVVDHLRARVCFDRGQLQFIDTRRFGEFRLVDDLTPYAPAGLDPVEQPLSAARLAKLAGSSKQPLKTWLLRQDRLVGLGNIYASEICFHAGLDPRRPLDTLATADWRRVAIATRDVLARAIEACGTTFSDFQGAQGVNGSYQQYLAVYGRDGLACPRCGRPIERLVQVQRSTFFCAACQK
ncbi:MAG: bifunctional DNA-formamidopyrimidine glycosylase/DNA-(apurinic or apyrimidinic site) lyase [Deltaproteobacteria bacterium]|nr:bifunctional DNA-formamidopyrimidine glycosylase/DNA-(apurinic or apyrimidinic site) lyase [Deltaproteobacteria bacterium]